MTRGLPSVSRMGSMDDKKGTSSVLKCSTGQAGTLREVSHARRKPPRAGRVARSGAEFHPEHPRPTLVFREDFTPAAAGRITPGERPAFDAFWYPACIESTLRPFKDIPRSRRGPSERPGDRSRFPAQGE